MSLSSSLEMHVELTLQLQQEVDNLKDELVSRLKQVQFVGGKRLDKHWIQYSHFCDRSRPRCRNPQMELQVQMPQKLHLTKNYLSGRSMYNSTKRWQRWKLAMNLRKRDTLRQRTRRCSPSSQKLLTRVFKWMKQRRKKPLQRHHQKIKALFHHCRWWAMMHQRHPA